MRNIFLSLFLSVCIPGVSFGQITPTGSGSVLTYDVFNAKQQPYKKDITFQPDKEQRVLKLSIEENGDRKYVFMSDKPFAAYDKYFAATSHFGKAVDREARYSILPINQKIEAGVQWSFGRQGHANACGNWTVAYHAVTKDGPDTFIKLDGKEIAVKTLLIEFRGDAKSDKCDPYQQERLVLYAPVLNELLMDQWIEFIPGRMTSDFGYKWVLKSVSTTASQIPK